MEPPPTSPLHCEPGVTLTKTPRPPLYGSAGGVFDPHKLLRGAVVEGRAYNFLLKKGRQFKKVKNINLSAFGRVPCPGVPLRRGRSAE